MNYLIFGGNGFVGNHLISLIYSKNLENCKIYNLDKSNSKNEFYTSIILDVRKKIDLKLSDTSNSIIFNLAAVHVTPGHPNNEYFETNVLGAENICTFARENDITTIVFTSSIAPYGVSETIKTEESLPYPNTPYGISKLNAEYIHKIWQAEDPKRRRLIIVRPGVIFGKGESGNFTRLYNSLKKGTFFYPGRKDTLKAAVYVKDVVRILFETTNDKTPEVITYNLTYFPTYSIEEICNTICKVTDIRKPKIIIPSILLQSVAKVLYLILRITGRSFDGIHPQRVKKLMISTNVSGEKLSKSKYHLKFSFREALEDWFTDCKRQGLF